MGAGAADVPYDQEIAVTSKNIRYNNANPDAAYVSNSWNQYIPPYKNRGQISSENVVKEYLNNKDQSNQVGNGAYT